MIINSFLDNDLYKFTMQQLVFHQFPDVRVRYKFKCRTKGIKFSKNCVDSIYREAGNWQSIKITEDELKYLGTLKYMKKDYLNFLKTFSNRRQDICIGLDKEGKLQISAEGKWLDTILCEVPLLAIVNECYFKENGVPDPIGSAVTNLREKLLPFTQMLQYAPVIDFGTRRRYSRKVHETVIEILKGCPSFDLRGAYDMLRGTSNVDLARKYDLTPQGTMAHEYIQCHQALVPDIKTFQKVALDNWVKEYRVDLGIALTDTIGMNAFLKDFDGYYAKLYDGCRHDSGDPYVWGEKLIKHYRKLGINPGHKLAVFSDGLTLEKASDLSRYFMGRLNTSFGIGTSLTNDVGINPIQIVIKVVECNGLPVAKLSDSKGKGMCENNAYENKLRKVFHVK